MNIRNIPTENLIFWDSEVVRACKKLNPKSEEYRLFRYKYRDKDTEELLPEKEIIEKYNKIAALNPIFSKIVCISVGMITKGIVNIKGLVGEEQDILNQFVKIITHKPNYRLVGFNNLHFDWPLAERKLYINKIEIPERFSSFESKPWLMAEAHLDLMDVFKGAGFYSDSLEAVCYAMGVPNPKTNIHGSEVSDLYWANPKKNIDQIKEYCNGDVKATIDLFLSMQGKSIIK
jgi:DNA polymerase elongation subunit (family B)